MNWVERVLESLRGGPLPWDASSLGEVPWTRAEATASVEGLAEVDAALGSDRAHSHRRRARGTNLRELLAELLRRTAKPAGRLGLALAQTPSPDRPGPELGFPDYFDDWFPQLPARLRRYDVAELGVHVLAAEVRARRAGTLGGASRPQDVYAVLLLFREALRHPGHSRRYMELVRREFPEFTQALPVAASLIRSSLVSAPTRRYYRTPEILLSLLEAESADEAERAGLGGARRRASLALDLKADALASGWLDAQRAAGVARQARDALAPPFDRGTEVAWAWAREALEAAVSAAQALEAAGLTSGVRRPAETLARHCEDGPRGISLETCRTRTLHAVGSCKRAASEMKTIASEASDAAAAAARARPPLGGPQRSVADLRAAMGIS